MTDSYRGPFNCLDGLCDLLEGFGPLDYAARTDLLALQVYCESTQSDDHPSDGPSILFSRSPQGKRKAAGSPSPDAEGSPPNLSAEREAEGPASPPDNGGAGSVEPYSKSLKWTTPEEKERTEEEKVTNKRKELDKKKGLNEEREKDLGKGGSEKGEKRGGGGRSGRKKHLPQKKKQLGKGSGGKRRPL